MKILQPCVSVFALRQDDWGKLQGKDDPKQYCKVNKLALIYLRKVLNKLFLFILEKLFFVYVH